MVEIFEVTTEEHDNARGAEDMARARDRVLLYARGLDVDPVLSLELALESLRRSDPRREGPPDPAVGNMAEVRDKRGAAFEIERAMGALYELLSEKGLTPGLTDSQGEPLRSVPAMNRRSMIAEEMDRSPLRRVLKKLGSITRSNGAETEPPQS